MEKKQFEDYFYVFLLYLEIIAGACFLIAGYYFDGNFFLNFSEDRELSANTLEVIKDLRIALLSLGMLFLGFFLFSRKFKRQIRYAVARNRAIIEGVVLFVGTAFLFLIIGELVAYSFHQKNPPLLYEFGSEGIKLNFPKKILNNEGVRDIDFSLSAPENTSRIIVLGDSYTWGSGIKNASDTYPKVLERKIGAFNFSKKYEVLNFGISGIDTKRELGILEERGLKYNPEIIILGYVLNDLENVDPKVKGYKRLRLPLVGFTLSGISYLYNFMEARINKLAENLGRRNYEESLIDYFNSEANKENARKTFERLSEISKERDIKVVIAIFPPFYNMQDYPFSNAHKLIKAISKEKGFYYIDLLEVYKNYSAEELEVSRSNSHPNEFGHEIAAETIFNRFIEEKIIIRDNA